MTRDLSYKLKEKDPPKQLKLVEKTSPNSDVIYTEIHNPFLTPNRELVQKRLFVGNKEDPEVVKQLGLFDWSHRYYVILVQSTERPEYPVSTERVRGVTTMAHILLEEDPNENGAVKATFLICQDLDLPKSFKALEEGIGFFAVLGLIGSYAQAFGDGK